MVNHHPHGAVRSPAARFVAILGAFAFIAVGVRADDALQPAEQRSYRPYPAIELTAFVFENPRPIRAWTAAVDLTAPEVKLVTTPRGEVGPAFETSCVTTRAFAEGHGAQLAVNATPFEPHRDKEGEGVNLLGLAACNGDVYSMPHERYGALLVRADGSVDIVAPPFDRSMLDGVALAVGGTRLLVRDGVDHSRRVVAASPPKAAGPHARSSVGLSADGKTLWLIVADGGNLNRSEGMTLGELAAFGRDRGCAQLLELDGGNSTTLVLQDPGSQVWRVVNRPAGGRAASTERPVGNNLGIRILPKQESP